MQSATKPDVALEELPAELDALLLEFDALLLEFDALLLEFEVLLLELEVLLLELDVLLVELDTLLVELELLLAGGTSPPPPPPPQAFNNKQPIKELAASVLIILQDMHLTSLNKSAVSLYQETPPTQRPKINHAQVRKGYFQEINTHTSTLHPATSTPS